MFNVEPKLVGKGVIGFAAAATGSGTLVGAIKGSDVPVATLYFTVKSAKSTSLWHLTDPNRGSLSYTIDSDFNVVQTIHAPDKPL